MLDAKARAVFDGLSRATGTALARLGLTPNAVTLIGLGLVGAASWRVVDGDLVLAGILLAVGGCFDFLDGAVARVTGRASELGAFLDSVVDRLSDAAILGSLLWYELSRGDRQAAALALAALVVGGLVPYLRAKAEALGYDARVGIMERAERVVVLCVGLIFGLVTAALWLLSVLSAVTAVQRLVHVGRQARGRA